MHQQRCFARIEEFLDSLLTLNNENTPARLHAAMRYSVLNGGKRLRSLLVYTTGKALGAKWTTLDATAAAVELIHSYSLVHDDLPAMDNDHLRRGKPTCHKAFDEALAILTGDALQALAFQTLSDAQLNPIHAEQQIKMIRILSETCGASGMVGGQAMDMDVERLQAQLPLSLEQLCTLHQQKTGALITASVLLGAIAAGCQDPQSFVALENYSHAIGLAFQIQDDILDLTSDTQTLGKTAGKDALQEKVTFPTLMGLEAAQQYVHNLHQNALTAIECLEEKGKHLSAVSQLLLERIS